MAEVEPQVVELVVQLYRTATDQDGETKLTFVASQKYLDFALQVSKWTRQRLTLYVKKGSV